MKINKQPLTVEEVELLQGLGVVLDDPNEGVAHFEKKRAVPPGMKLLPGRKLIPWTPIEQLLTKW